MERTKAYIAIEGLMDLSKKASKACHREYEENDCYCFGRNFTSLSWYSRLSVNRMPSKDENTLSLIKEICSETDSPKYLTLSDVCMYENFEVDFENIGFKLVKRQKGMLYDLSNAPKYDECKNIIDITPENIDQWIETCLKGFQKQVTTPEFEIFMNDKDCHFYGYEHNGKIVSTAFLNVCGENGSIHEVTTLEEYRKKGAASELIKHIINKSQIYGCKTLSLQASVFGEPVYKKLGFEEVSSIGNYIL